MKLEYSSNSEILPEVRDNLEQTVRLRRDLHAHPELGMQTVRTAALVAQSLRSYGCDAVFEGIGETGVVALIYGRTGPGTHTVALRADMDALPLTEKTGCAWSSVTDGTMHACGHDGHTAWLLAVAQALCLRRDFTGTVMLIAQPGEEGYAGARAMIEDGLFTRWKVDEVYAAHGASDLALGTYGFTAGPMMAAADRFAIRVQGVGGHGGRPHSTIDPVVCAASLVMNLQSIVSRSADPMHPAVVTVGHIQGGSAQGVSVIPQTVELAGTTRCLYPQDRDMIERRLQEICRGTEITYGARVVLDYVRMYPPLINHDTQNLAAIAVTQSVVGPEKTDCSYPASMGAEDFSFMLEKVPGAYFRVGMRDSTHTASAHNPAFDFNDRCLGVTATVLTRLMQARLAHLNG